MDLTVIAIVPIVVALVTVLKGIPAVANRTWLQPILAMIVGVLLTTVVVMGWPPEPYPPLAQLAARSLLTGVVNGLAGAGLYDTGKGVITAGRTP